MSRIWEANSATNILHRDAVRAMFATGKAAAHWQVHATTGFNHRTTARGVMRNHTRIVAQGDDNNETEGGDNIINGMLLPVQDVDDADSDGVDSKCHY